MPKLVEFPSADLPPQLLLEEWFDCHDFFLFNFTLSELEVSGFMDWYPMDDEHDPVLPLIDYIEHWEEFVSPMQALVYRAFDKRASGAIRELWLRGVYEDPQLRDTVLMRFPIEIAVEARRCLDATALSGWQDHDRFVQCVAMLHAYTGLPSGEKSASEIAAERVILESGAAGRLIRKIASQ